MNTHAVGTVDKIRVCRYDGTPDHLEVTVRCTDPEHRDPFGSPVVSDVTFPTFLDADVRLGDEAEIVIRLRR